MTYLFMPDKLMETYLPSAFGLQKKTFSSPCGTCMLPAQRRLADIFAVEFPKKWEENRKSFELIWHNYTGLAQSFWR